MSLQSLSAQYKSLFFSINSPVLGSAIGKPVLKKYFKNLAIQFKDFNSKFKFSRPFSKRFQKFPKSKQTHSLTNSVQGIWRSGNGETNCNVVVFIKEKCNYNKPVFITTKSCPWRWIVWWWPWTVSLSP